MNTELTGVNDAVVEEIPEQVAAEQDSDVVSIADLLDNSNEDATAEEKGEQPTEDAPEANTGDADHEAEEQARKAQERENIAFAKRLAAEKKKLEKQYESNPFYQLGREMADKHGGDADAALKAIREQRAEELAKDPAALAKFVMEQKYAAVSAPVNVPEINTENETEEQKVGRMVSELHNLLGDGADIEAYLKIDPDFLANCDKKGVARAVADLSQKIVTQHQTAAQLAQNRRLPQPIRPSGNAQPKAVDFSAMSDKEFAAFEAKAKKARLDGKKIMI